MTGQRGSGTEYEHVLVERGQEGFGDHLGVLICCGQWGAGLSTLDEGDKGRGQQSIKIEETVGTCHTPQTAPGSSESRKGADVS